jgi:hypothetical protein
MKNNCVLLIYGLQRMDNQSEFCALSSLSAAAEHNFQAAQVHNSEQKWLFYIFQTSSAVIFSKLFDLFAYIRLCVKTAIMGDHNLPSQGRCRNTQSGVIMEDARHCVRWSLFLYIYTYNVWREITTILHWWTRNLEIPGQIKVNRLWKFHRW